MSNPTDILGKVGQKVGVEIKSIKDNYATKVSLGNVVSTIDFSPYATVVSLGTVKSGLEGDISSAESRLQTSLGNYADGTNVFSNLKATRAEVDELLVKGDTTIVSTQKVEISDNVIEVNLAGNGDVTADTGGVAVNRGLVAAALNPSSTHISYFGNYGKTADNIDSFDVEFKLSSDLGKPYNLLRPAGVHTPVIKFENPSDQAGLQLTTVGKLELSDADITQVPTGQKCYRGFSDPGTRVNDKGAGEPLEKRYVPKYLRTKTGITNVVWEHTVEDMGAGDQDVWKRLDDTANASGDYYMQIDPSNPVSDFELQVTDQYGNSNSSQGSYLTEMEVVPRSQSEYIRTFRSGDPNTPAGAGAAELPPAVKSSGVSGENIDITKWLSHGSAQMHTYFGTIKGSLTYDGSPSSYYEYDSPDETYGGDTYKTRAVINGSNVEISAYLNGVQIPESTDVMGTIYLVTNQSPHRDNIQPSSGWGGSFLYAGDGSQIDTIHAQYIGSKPAGAPNTDTMASLSAGSAGNDMMWAISASGDASGGVLDAIFVGFGTKSGSGQSATLTNSSPATMGSKVSDILNWSNAGVNGDADLLWDETKGAWVLRKDTAAAKLYYANKFDTVGELPSATDYHGMFAHVHGTGRGYFSHNGAWQELLDLSANQTISGNLDVSAGSAIKVADSSGIKINNIDLGNYASFESALMNLLNPPAPSAVSTVGAGVNASTVEFPTTQSGAVVFADTVTYTKNGVKHVYKKTGSDYATVVLNGTNRYFYINYLLDTSESDAGATDTYGKFGTISHDNRNIPRYFYVSGSGSISSAYLGGSGTSDLSSYGPSVLTIDPFVILFPGEVSPLA